MHPLALLDKGAELVQLALRFEHPADGLVSRYFQENRSLGSRDRALLADLLHAVLRRLRQFEQLAATGAGPAERRLAMLGFPDAPHALAPLLPDPQQRWLLDSLQVERASLPEEARYNLPSWLIEALRVQVGERFEALVEAFEREAPLDLRVNALKARRERVLSALQVEGLQAQQMPYSPWGLRLAQRTSLAGRASFQQGDIEVQDEGSQLLALLTDARREQLVVDFCAGAGGKTLALGAAMRNTGRLYAFDTSQVRLEALRPRLARSGLANVHPMAISGERDERVLRLAGKADRVLVDAPCSGLGTLRRHPDLKWRVQPEAVAGLVELQRRVLAQAARLVRPGGRLVYATCSVLPEENEAVAQAFSRATADFVPEDVAQLLSAAKVPESERLCSESGGVRHLRLWPDLHGTDGFFAAVWRRR